MDTILKRHRAIILNGFRDYKHGDGKIYGKTYGKGGGIYNRYGHGAGFGKDNGVGNGDWYSYQYKTKGFLEKYITR